MADDYSIRVISDKLFDVRRGELSLGLVIGFETLSVNHAGLGLSILSANYTFQPKHSQFYPNWGY